MLDVHVHIENVDDGAFKKFAVFVKFKISRRGGIKGKSQIYFIIL